MAQAFADQERTQDNGFSKRIRFTKCCFLSTFENQGISDSNAQIIFKILEFVFQYHEKYLVKDFCCINAAYWEGYTKKNCMVHGLLPVNTETVFFECVKLLIESKCSDIFMAI